MIAIIVLIFSRGREFICAKPILLTNDYFAAVKMVKCHRPCDAKIRSESESESRTHFIDFSVYHEIHRYQLIDFPDSMISEPLCFKLTIKRTNLELIDFKLMTEKQMEIDVTNNIGDLLSMELPSCTSKYLTALNSMSYLLKRHDYSPFKIEIDSAELRPQGDREIRYKLLSFPKSIRSPVEMMLQWRKTVERTAGTLKIQRKNVIRNI